MQRGQKGRRAGKSDVVLNVGAREEENKRDSARMLLVETINSRRRASQGAGPVGSPGVVREARSKQASSAHRGAKRPPNKH